MPSVSLHLPSHPENVALAREVLAGLADTVTLSREQYDDMRTALTEACNNVVRHAYADGPGPMEVEVALACDAVWLTVRDQGIGLSHAAAEAGGEMEIGLPVILALTDRLELGHTPEGGAEVQMRFLAPGVEAPAGPRPHRREQLPEIVLPHSHADARVAFADAELARSILPRLACALAARAHFTADRVSDVQLLCDEIAAYARPPSRGAHLEAALTAAARRLDIQIAPLARGSAERLLSRGLVQALHDQASVTPMGPDEALVLTVTDRA